MGRQYHVKAVSCRETLTPHQRSRGGDDVKPHPCRCSIGRQGEALVITQGRVRIESSPEMDGQPRPAQAKPDDSVGSMTENDVWGLVGTKRVKLSHLGECLGPPTLWVLAGAPYTLKLIKSQAVERLQEGNEVPDCREFQCSCQSKGLCYLQSYVRLDGDQELERNFSDTPGFQLDETCTGFTSLLALLRDPEPCARPPELRQPVRVEVRRATNEQVVAQGVKNRSALQQPGPFVGARIHQWGPGARLTPEDTKSTPPRTLPRFCPRGPPPPGGSKAVWTPGSPDGSGSAPPAITPTDNEDDKSTPCCCRQQQQPAGSRLRAQEGQRRAHSDLLLDDASGHDRPGRGGIPRRAPGDGGPGRRRHRPAARVRRRGLRVGLPQLRRGDGDERRRRRGLGLEARQEEGQGGGVGSGADGGGLDLLRAPVLGVARVGPSRRAPYRRPHQRRAAVRAVDRGQHLDHGGLRAGVAEGLPSEEPGVRLPGVLAPDRCAVADNERRSFGGRSSSARKTVLAGGRRVPPAGVPRNTEGRRGRGRRQRRQGYSAPGDRSRGVKESGVWPGSHGERRDGISSPLLADVRLEATCLRVLSCRRDGDVHNG
ncbi:hypothetical protein THAOC_02525 [Thalassiosira oceanica]|uniref:Uncharacterized protein n=1 Tax=Thalassiosira oceanica TaxID=159749 RepID=K0TQB3_THAOC|nr:hypothetical protein THAOC_02525 [Thalassiosira oceanica]|eukprot:EJK75747.1 hypothetical protein THAOC_02525 [Thalassiosira oceanica]